MTIKFIPHTADIEFKVSANSLEEAFKDLVRGFSKSICKKKIEKKIEKKIKISGIDLKNLIYNFVEELVILFDSEYFLSSSLKEIKIDKKNMKLECVLIGDFAGNYEIYSNIKSITYSDMIAEKKNNKWIVQVILDV